MAAMGTPDTTRARIHDSILDAIGDTPVVRLSRLASGLSPQVVAKVESLNPGGSIKDRVAVSLIDASSSPQAQRVAVADASAVTLAVLSALWTVCPSASRWRAWCSRRSLSVLAMRMLRC